MEQLLGIGITLCLILGVNMNIGRILRDILKELKK